MNLKGKNMLDYIEISFITKLWKVVRFLFIYTLGFLLLVVSFKYAIPFVIAFLLAVALQPIKNKILEANKKNRYIKLSNGFTSLILTLLVVVVIFLILGGAVYEATNQSIKLLEYLTNPKTVNEIITNVDSIIKVILSRLDGLDQSILEKINEGIMIIVQLISGFATNFGKSLLSFAVSIPITLIMVIITLISTYFFTKEMDYINLLFKGVFSSKGHKLLNNIKDKLGVAIGGYIKAYVIIMFLVAFVSYVIFKIAKIEYSLALAGFTAVIDFLPILGSGVVYITLAIKAYFDGNTTAAIILIIGFIIVALVKQLLEQNLLASFIGVHPLVMIVGLFIALTPFGFLGMFYFIGAFLLYQIVK